MTKSKVNKFYKLRGRGGGLQIVKNPVKKNVYSVIRWNNYGEAFYYMNANSGTSKPFPLSRKKALLIADKIRSKR